MKLSLYLLDNPFFSKTVNGIFPGEKVFQTITDESNNGTLGFRKKPGNRETRDRDSYKSNENGEDGFFTISEER